MKTLEALSFDSAIKLDTWFEKHHDIHQELWIRIYKKSSSKTSVTWNECVISAISWGWIDSQRKSMDDISYLQRFTPRRYNSMWSQKNRKHAERLIAEGKMQPSGMSHIKAAQQNGRWQNAYFGSSDMVIPKDFLKELRKNFIANNKYQSLGRSKRFLIYHGIQTARNPNARKKRIVDFIKRIERDSL